MHTRCEVLLSILPKQHQMNKSKCFFAVDLGATSGRTIIGTISQGKVNLEEITRFPNNLIETGGHFYWDIYALYFEIIKGLMVKALVFFLIHRAVEVVVLTAPVVS